MAKLYGSVQGSRGQAHRLGASSLRTVAASWEGSVKVWLFERGSETHCAIELDTWHGAGTSILIYKGPIHKFDPAGLGDVARKAVIKHFAHGALRKHGEGN